MKIWEPDDKFKSKASLNKYINFLSESFSISFENYNDLHLWSIKNLDQFWESITLFFEVTYAKPYQSVLIAKTPFYKTQWFQGAELSYTAHLLRYAQRDKIALIATDETEIIRHITWNALLKRAATFKNQLSKHGIKKGDVVVGFLLNHPDTVALFLAVNALGAVWSCCSPDFGIDSVIDRFEQLQPKFLFAHKAYTYAGKRYDQSSKIDVLKNRLPSLIGLQELSDQYDDWDFGTKEFHDLNPISVAFDHPIWVLFSSGTTGKPKAITHRTGGMLLEQYKALALHQNVQAGQRFFWNTTTGWMMWNYALGSLLCGATLCLYDGAANYPDLGVQWRFAKRANIHHFGNGAPLYSASVKKQIPEINCKDLASLITLGSTGSPLSEDAFVGLQNRLPEVHIISLSGGTDVCSAFIGGNPMLAVFAGFLQCKMLGAAIEAWDSNGTSVENQTGELVLTQPMPSMPLYFWGDTNFERYHESYFFSNKTVWTHGDWITVDPDRGIKVEGRSDATLNRNGIRIGTAEIYAALDRLAFVKDTLVVEAKNAFGVSQILLFVVYNAAFESGFENEIKKHLRTTCSPRHVPDLMFTVPEIPYTLSGKKMEIPIKKLFEGRAMDQVVQAGAMKNPKSIELFFEISKNWKD